jgi:CO/xanthine dehydrogenase Mo-binding subunit
MSIEIPSLPEDMPGAELKYVGKDVKRIEDPGLVTGAVEFIDNLHLPNMAHCAMLRSPHPHARITSYDTSAAEALPGVVAVITGEDVKAWANPVVTAPEGWGAYCLAVDKVRFVGEPVVAVAAESRYLARSDQRRRYQAVRGERKQRHPLQDVRLG